MAYIKLTTALTSLAPCVKIITTNTVELFLHKIQEGYTLAGAARALSLNQKQLKELTDRHIIESELHAAMKMGAEVVLDEATQSLRLASEPFELEQAKALAQHFRWLASKLNKKQYGDAVKVDQNVAPSYEFNINLLGNASASNIIEHEIN